MTTRNAKHRAAEHRPGDRGARGARRAHRQIAVFAVLGLLLLLGASCDTTDPPTTPDPPPPGPGPGPTPPGPTPPGPTPPGPTPPALPPVLGNACPGVVVHASQPDTASGVSSATIVIDWGNSASAGGFDWISPYLDDDTASFNRSRSPRLEVHVVGWWIESTGGATRHTLSVEWPPFRALDLRFHAGGNCTRPALICADGSCDLD